MKISPVFLPSVFLSKSFDFFGPNCKARKGAGTENLGQGNISGISALRNEYAPKPDAIVTGIEGVPAFSEIDLHPGSKIHRRVRRRNPDIAHITRAIPRGDVETAAERDREMREIPANAVPLGVGLRRRARRAGVFVAECEMAMHKVANGLDARPAERRVLEKTPCFLRQDVGLAISAAE